MPKIENIIQNHREHVMVTSPQHSYWASNLSGKNEPLSSQLPLQQPSLNGFQRVINYYSTR